MWDGGLALPTLCLLVVGVAWVCSASVMGGGGGEVPFPVVWGLPDCVAFEILGWWSGSRFPSILHSAKNV